MYGTYITYGHHSNTKFSIHLPIRTASHANNNMIIMVQAGSLLAMRLFLTLYALFGGEIWEVISRLTKYQSVKGKLPTIWLSSTYQAGIFSVRKH